MSSVQVELKEVVVRHGKQNLLGPVSLTIETGDFWGIVGPNGAGKSTLLEAIVGLRKVSEGKIRFGGPSFSNDGTDPRCRQVGFLFQHQDFSQDFLHHLQKAELSLHLKF